MKTLVPVVVLLLFVLRLNYCKCSIGDHSLTYRRCLENCIDKTCESDGVEYINKRQPFYLRLLQWTCQEECRYQCMWVAVKYFHRRDWSIPQFHGKWPFTRVFGIQEVASVLFSFLNLYAHVRGIKRFRKEVPSDAPLYWLWHYHFLVFFNAWIWSMVFHTRDKPLTEMLDYIFAFSTILISCYSMMVRLVRGLLPNFFVILLSVFFTSSFANHALYLSVGQFDYSYNMKLNICLGTFTAFGWFFWSIYNRLRLPYCWKIAVYVSLTGLSTLLELFDKPPFFWIIDWHALWHLSTALVTPLFYSFIIDDCKYLKKINDTENKEVRKQDSEERKRV